MVVVKWSTTETHIMCTALGLGKCIQLKLVNSSNTTWPYMTLPQGHLIYKSPYLPPCRGNQIMIMWCAII